MEKSDNKKCSKNGDNSMPDPLYGCLDCKLLFKLREELHKHVVINGCKVKTAYFCPNPKCLQDFDRSNNCKRHIKPDFSSCYSRNSRNESKSKPNSGGKFLTSICPLFLSVPIYVRFCHFCISL